MKLLKDKKHMGFTLIEILIALTLSSFVFIIVSTLIVTLFTTNAKSKRSESLLQVKNDLFVELSNSIRWAKIISVDALNSTLEVDGLFYTLSGGELRKDGQTMTPTNVVVTKFDLREAVTVPEYPGVEISIEFKDKATGLTSDQVNIFVANRKVELDL